MACSLTFGWPLLGTSLLVFGCSPVEKSDARSVVERQDDTGAPRPSAPEPDPSALEPDLSAWVPGSASFVALAAAGGLIVAARGAPQVGFVLERLDGESWEPLGTLTGSEVWVGAPTPPSTLLRARRVGSGALTPVFQPSAVVVSWDAVDEATPMLLEEEEVAPTMTLSALPAAGLGPASLRVSLDLGWTTLYLPEGCLDFSCWTEEETGWTDAPDLAGLSTSYTATFAAPGLGPTAATLTVELSVHTESGRILVSRSERPLILLGGRWYWGDLHAHSRWSNDGCEDPDELCGPRGDGPGEDFFANAGDAGLDFAAITDHAEWDWYWPDGAEGEPIPVWDGQAGTASDAVSGDVLPILGYEWSHGSESMEGVHRRGSHRTVLLSDPSACESYRIGGLYAEDAWTPELGEWYFTADNERIAESVSNLWSALDEADTTCGTELRWVTFAHHSAYEIPQATDWSLSENLPERETLLEIYSEHGSSECYDTAVDGCSFGLNERQTYYPDGSAHSALDSGFTLGFVGGTDGHDGRPGSLDDGPGTVAWWRDSDGDGLDDTPTEQFGAGGLTGALVSGALDMDGLFDALEARTTMATSGPRPALRVIASGASGALYGPGAVMPASDAPFLLFFVLDDRVDEHTGALFQRVDQMVTGGLLEESYTEQQLELVWNPEPGDWTYLRLRYTNTDGSEGRVWLSPFFAE